MYIYIFRCQPVGTEFRERSCCVGGRSVRRPHLWRTCGWERSTVRDKHSLHGLAMLSLSAANAVREPLVACEWRHWCHLGHSTYSDKGWRVQQVPPYAGQQNLFRLLRHRYWLLLVIVIMTPDDSMDTIATADMVITLIMMISIAVAMKAVTVTINDHYHCRHLCRFVSRFIEPPESSTKS